MPGTGRHRGRGNAGDGPSRFASGAMTTPLRLNRYDTEPGSAIEPAPGPVRYFTGFAGATGWCCGVTVSSGQAVPRGSWYSPAIR
jgi:hypothetical protein